VSRTRLADAELYRFGVRPEDEGFHPFDPAVAWWNESWFWDWFDADGRLAGHCRVGTHPNQDRLWVWLYLKRGDEWLAVEEPRLPLGHLAPGRLAYDRFGLAFSWDAADPFRHGRFRCRGFGRVLSGSRAGMILPVSADLEVEGLGPPHSPGQSTAAGHGSETYSASRLEQPIALRGELAVADEVLPFEGRGERDHSWGPRHWNLEWTFLVLNGDALRMMCAVAEIPGVGRFPGGYLYRDDFQALAEVALDVEVAGRPVLDPVAGRFTVRTESGDALAGTVESVSGTEIDITHTFVPPQRSLYRRALVRARLDGAEGGAAPLMGWLEFNRLARVPA